MACLCIMFAVHGQIAHLRNILFSKLRPVAIERYKPSKKLKEAVERHVHDHGVIQNHCFASKRALDSDEIYHNPQKLSRALGEANKIEALHHTERDAKVKAFQEVPWVHWEVIYTVNKRKTLP